MTVVLQSEFSAGKSTNTLQEMILDAPIWSDMELHEYEAARTNLNQSRIT